MAGTDAGIIDMRVQPAWRWTDADPEIEVADNLQGYERVYGLTELQNQTQEELVTELRRLGIRAVLQSEPTWGSTTAWNDRVAEALTRDPDCFVTGFCAADPRDIMAGVREIDRCYHELGLRGLAMCCDFFNVDLADKRCYPLYAKAAELGIPVGLHVGINFTTDSPIRHGHPAFVDELACAFPELILICNHGGWPWPTETIAVAWKHHNVYLEFGAIAPRYIASQGGGWGPMRHFMNSVLQDRVLFATDWPALPHQRALDELDLLELKDTVREKYLRTNAESLLDRILG